MLTEASVRHLWQLYEPLHAVTYFAPEAKAAYESIGLRGYWRGYFAGRAAPLGSVVAAPVTALFFSFAPAMVARALPDVWQRVSPQQALAARLDGAVAALRAAFPPESGRDQMQPNRGWSDAEWDAAARALAERGWLGGDGRPTATGQAAHRAVERRTDQLAAQPWTALSRADRARLSHDLAPLAGAAGAVVPYPNPMGVRRADGVSP